jgi:hypothetical protein
METAMPKTPSPTIPGMTDSLEFVKNLWGSMNVPGMGMSAMSVPGVTGAPLSTDDLDKKIADLKAVESWLNLNTTMLRGTIQALEVQRATLATLKTMSANMARAMEQGTEQAAQFAQFFAQPQGAGAASAASQQKQQQGQSQQGGQAGASQGAAAPAPAAAVAWWNLLQEQFKQAVESAMSAEAMAGAAAVARNAASLATGGAVPAAGAPKPEAKAKAQGDSGNASAQPGVQTPWPPKSGPGQG